MTSYTTIAGDMWDSIAYKTLGSEMYTDKIIAENLSHREMVIFGAGIKLNIPDKTVSVTSTLPPWKQV